MYKLYINICIYLYIYFFNFKFSSLLSSLVFLVKALYPLSSKVSWKLMKQYLSLPWARTQMKTRRIFSLPDSSPLFRFQERGIEAEGGLPCSYPAGRGALIHTDKNRSWDWQWLTVDWVARNKGKKLLAFFDTVLHLQQLNFYQFDPSLCSFEFNSASVYWVPAVCRGGRFERKDVASLPLPPLAAHLQSALSKLNT